MTVCTRAGNPWAPFPNPPASRLSHDVLTSFQLPLLCHGYALPADWVSTCLRGCLRRTLHRSHSLCVDMHCPVDWVPMHLNGRNRRTVDAGYSILLLDTSAATVLLDPSLFIARFRFSASALALSSPCAWTTTSTSLGPEFLFSLGPEFLGIQHSRSYPYPTHPSGRFLLGSMLPAFDHSLCSTPPLSSNWGPI